MDGNEIGKLEKGTTAGERNGHGMRTSVDG